jgi:hypothetical protein
MPQFNPIIDDFTMFQYNWIKDKILQEEYKVCLKTAKSCPWSSFGLKGRANRACCGFITPAIGLVLQYYSVLLRNRIKEPELDKDMRNNENLYRNRAIHIGLNFYTLYTGYGDSPYSWNKNCNQWNNNLIEGINIVTFYGRNQQDIKTCMTYHHFIVCNYGYFSILIDSWAGEGGYRGEWTRIMVTSHIIDILNVISTTTNFDVTNRLLNAYFIVPHSEKINNTIEKNLMPELLSVGAYNLDNPKWREILDILEKKTELGVVGIPRYGGKKSILRKRI